MNLQTDFKLAGPLAGLFGGIQEGQQEQARSLQNTYQELKNQEQQYTSAEAQAKMQDPNYIKMKLENDISKFGKDMEINKIEQGYNMTTRALTDLKIAAAQGPQVLQQKALGYMQQIGIDPNSQQGRMILQDPVGFAEKTQQFYASAATQNADYQQKYALGEQSAQKALDVAKLQGENALRVAQLHESGQNARHNQTLGTDKLLGEMIKKANAGDEDAMAWVNTYTQIQRAKNPAFGGMTLNPQGGMTTKGELSPLPFAQKPKSQPVTVEAGGKVYSFPNQAAADKFKQDAGIK